MLKSKMEDLVIRCVRAMGAAILAATTPKGMDFLKRRAWGVVCTALGVCLLWYAIECLVEARTNTRGGYVPVYVGHGPDREWIDDRWAGPSEYRRDKYADVFVSLLFVGICAGAAYHFFVPDDPWKRRHIYFMRCDTDEGEPTGALGVGLSCGPYFDGGWKLIDRKKARALAKSSTGRYVFTAGGPDRVCSQRDYLSVIRNQRRVEDIAVTVAAHCLVWAGAGGEAPNYEGLPAGTRLPGDSVLNP